MTGNPSFALNHMCAPNLGITQFFDLATELGISAVEIRNDLAGQAILDGTAPETIRQEAEKRGLSIISINALQRFNDWNAERAREARELIGYAASCGAQGLVLVPVNDGSGRADGERQANLRIALKELAPLLKAAGIKGLVEPLGFEICSLRSKSEAADIINNVDEDRLFALVHDTFHHYLAGEPEFFPSLTGLAHISGVIDGSLDVSDMRDGHRVLVDEHDRLGNVDQIRALTAGGYTGPLSFEPFAESVHKIPDIANALRDSMKFLIAGYAKMHGEPTA
jgi:2-keto-myo-inositol isomerase